MRAVDIAIAAFALRAAPACRPKPARRIVPAVDEPEAATLNRVSLDQTQAALIASLWPEPCRQCVVRPLYLHQEAPAVFGALHVVGRTQAGSAAARGARALLQRLHGAFGARGSAPPVDISDAA